MMCAYVAPEMLIEGKVLPRSKAEKAYKRMESAVLKSRDFYKTVTEFSFSEENVEFYAELEKQGPHNIPELAVMAMRLKARASY